MVKTVIFICFSLILFSFLIVDACALHKPIVISHAKTEKEQAEITPWKALQKLKNGNARFLAGAMRQRNFPAQVASSKKQFPFAVVLNCMDSRGATEIIFDQGIGDIFVERLAGNVVNRDVLGGMEYATKVVGAKLIVVLGHTSCGAVKGACENEKLGNLSQLLAKIKPAVIAVKSHKKGASCEDQATLNEISKQNVLNALKQIKQSSPVIMSLIKQGKIGLIGAMNNLATGEVTFLDGALLPGAP